MGVLGAGALCVLQAVVWALDLVTLPLYTLAQRPWRARRALARQRSEVVQEDEESLTIRAHHRMTKPLQVRTVLVTLFVKSELSLCRS